jgi:hypothetical protein
MRQGARSAITITVLLVLLAVAAVWGWSAATEPLPGKVDTPICVQRSVKAGTKVFPQDVAVSVYNASTRDGLAGRTMKLFTDAGFVKGSSGNVSARPPVSTSAIWTADPGSPAVRLVASRLGKGVRVVRRDAPGVGVAVVVGQGFTKLVPGKRAVVAADDAEICSPPVE